MSLRNSLIDFAIIDLFAVLVISITNDKPIIERLGPGTNTKHKSKGEASVGVIGRSTRWEFSVGVLGGTSIQVQVLSPSPS